MAENSAGKNKRRNNRQSEIPAVLQGRFEINDLLGEGSFAKVYHACNINSGESVAIKVLDKRKILNIGLTRQIKREIHSLRRVRHPNIVQIFEVMASKEKIYIVMEFVGGGELFTKVTKGRVKEQVARKYFQQLISAVGFCHSRGVFHRDLKPENLLLDENGNLKVTDFGLSTLSDKTSHTFCGTPAYLAPEVLLLTIKGYQAANVDIWSCGVILYELMAGCSPFLGDNVRALYKGEFRCPRWFSLNLTRLLTRLLDPNPKTRITIPEIMESKWFKKGFKHVNFYVEDGQLCSIEEGEEKDVASNLDESRSEYESELKSKGKEASLPRPASWNALNTGDKQSLSESDSEFETRRNITSFPRPASLNAFDIISFSRGLDLSGLFGENGEEARFLSHAPVSRILSKLEEIAKVAKFTVRKKGCRLSLQGSRESVKGPLVVAAEVFELTPSLVVLELKRNGGDRGEYEEFCFKELKPGLHDLMQEESASTSHRPS